MKDYLAIIRRNFASPIVLAILLLAMALVYVREYRDAWFISFVIMVNSLIGAVQEIRAKRALRKLELMSAPRARVVQADGTVTEVLYDALQVGDTLALHTGDELPADGVVLDAKGLEVNESMLTGESAAVDKAPGDAIYAATTVVAGTAHARVTAVGSATKAGAISTVLKQYAPQPTPLQRAIQRAITVLTYGAVVLALLIFARYHIAGLQAVSILKTIITAAITVVPEGLLLASSLLLAFGSLRLAQAKVLPQKLSAIEAMALLGVLCVDKTGTLTSDDVTFEQAASFDLSANDEMVAQYAALVAHETSGGNATGQAILAAHDAPAAHIQEVMAFSSSRKMAGVRAEIAGTVQTLMLGAPEFVARLAPLSPAQQAQIDAWANDGLRVLLLARFADSTVPLKQLTAGSGQPLGAIVLRNSLRHGVVDTVQFLQGQGVTIRVISGDNPRTVSYIAKAAGIHQPEAAITGAELAQLDDAAFAQAADTHTIFARVLPEQKERLIAHFSEQGRFTGMVGDGVNDALALKRADLGVAMYAGAPASRRVADIILLNNSFTSLPLGMKLGNRIMQAIELISVLFFHKIIYGVVLLAITLTLGIMYPYAPRHLTFMNIFLVTMPTIMWTLFPPSPRHRIDPRRFWHDTLLAVAPIAVLTGVAVASVYWLGRTLYPDRLGEVATMTVLVATFYGVYLVFLAGRMLGVQLDKRAHLARMLYMLAVLLVTVVSFGVGPLREFFDFTPPNLLLLWPGIAIIIPVTILQWWWAWRVGQRFVVASRAE